MRYIIFLGVLALLGFDHSPDGWIKLFNGKDLSGWHTYGQHGPAPAWKADNGTIHLMPGDKDGYQTKNGGDLITNERYENFELELEWKVSKGANSGIILYVQEDPTKYKETWHTGFEIQVCDNENNVDAHVFKRDAGAIYDLVPNPDQSVKPFGEWNKVQVNSINGKVDITLNGVRSVSFDMKNEDWKLRIAGSKFAKMPGFGMFSSGHVALQDHGQEVWYKNIRLKKM